jgi:hypothetical protein
MSLYAYKKYTNVTFTADGYLAAHARFGKESRYVPGDKLVLTFTGTVHADDPLAACERLFAIHNSDDRPDGRLCPSLSCGDLVVVMLDPGRSPTSPVAFAYSCEARGWQAQPLPEAADIDPRFWVQVMAEHNPW